MTAILESRKRAALQIAEVANAIGRTPGWLGMAEIGTIRLEPQVEKLILTAIGRLERFRHAVAAAREKLCADLKLPPAAPTRGHPHPGGSHAP